MKLRKQTPAKLLIAVFSGGLLVAFFGLVRSQPRVKTQPEQTTSGVDYQRFFSPSTSAASIAAALQTTHTRTRAS